MRSYEWAAGLFEGEGCLCVSKRRQVRPYGTYVYTVWSLSLVMTDEDAVREFARIVDLPVTTPKKRGDFKQTWRVGTQSAEKIAKILANLRPYLMSRRAKKADQFFDWYYARKEAA